MVKIILHVEGLAIFISAAIEWLDIAGGYLLFYYWRRIYPCLAI